MFTKFRNALINAVGGVEGMEYSDNHKPTSNYKYQYSRPSFLNFTEEEVIAASDTRIRPLILPRDVQFPFKAGYCECINAGKSKNNEDQGAFWRRTLKPTWLAKKVAPAAEVKISEKPAAVPSQPYDINQGGFTDLTFEDSSQSLGEIHDSHFALNGGCYEEEVSLPYTAFAIFDGHGGPMVAVASAHEMEDVLHQRLEEVIDLLLPDPDPDSMESEQHVKGGLKYQIDFKKAVSATQLIVGALESAFKEMDRRIGEDKETYRVRGGCTVLVVLFILGKVYTACAGDSRAMVAIGNSVEPLSRDHTPTSERSRICHVGFQKPFLLKNDYTSNEYHKRPSVHDLGKRVLYRHPEGFGYSYKTVETEDLKMPLISGAGKRARLLGTIGVTRGFGDHELTALGLPSSLSIKPFLSAVPEIRILNILHVELTSIDVIVMGSDGLFDVTTNTQAATVVRNSFNKMTNSDDRKYTCAAQDLVNYARGKPVMARSWKKNDGDPASGDDITAWVIPLLPYQLEYNQWYLNLPGSSRDADIEPYSAFKFRDEFEKLPITRVDESLLTDNDDSDSILAFQ